MLANKTKTHNGENSSLRSQEIYYHVVFTMQYYQVVLPTKWYSQAVLPCGITVWYYHVVIVVLPCDITMSYYHVVYYQAVLPCEITMRYLPCWITMWYEYIRSNNTLVIFYIFFTGFHQYYFLFLVEIKPNQLFEEIIS